MDNFIATAVGNEDITTNEHEFPRDAVQDFFNLFPSEIMCSIWFNDKLVRIEFRSDFE